MTKHTGVGQLINELIQLNIYRYHPPGPYPTNEDIRKCEARIKVIIDQLNTKEDNK